MQLLLCCVITDNFMPTASALSREQFSDARETGSATRFMALLTGQMVWAEQLFSEERKAGK